MVAAEKIKTLIGNPFQLNEMVFAHLGLIAISPKTNGHLTDSNQSDVPLSAHFNKSLATARRRACR